jgi:hypothetical protein
LANAELSSVNVCANELFSLDKVFSVNFKVGRRKTNFKLELDESAKIRDSRKFSGKLGYTFVD